MLYVQLNMSFTKCTSHYNSFFNVPIFKCKCRNFNAKLIVACELWMDVRVYLWVAASTVVQYNQYMPLPVYIVPHYLAWHRYPGLAQL